MDSENYEVHSVMDLIAMVTMLIDHVGLAFFPNELWFRIIGRIAFPLYAYSLARGYVLTSSKRNYMRRLFMLACLSQIPFSLLINPKGLNVIFTLMLSLAVMYLMDKYSHIAKRSLIAIAGCFLVEALNMDYGIYGLLLVLIYHNFKGLSMYVLHFVLNIAMSPLQIFSIVANYFQRFKSFRLVNRKAYMYFYPSHLMLLWIVKVIIVGGKLV